MLRNSIDSGSGRGAQSDGRIIQRLAASKEIDLPNTQIMNNAVSGVGILVDNFSSAKSHDLQDQQRTGVDRVRMEELAHELRQPLSAIESLAYYLEITATDEQTRVRLEQIRFLVERTNRILNQATLQA